MKKLVFSIFALMLILVSCGKSESSIQGTFLGGIKFGQSKTDALSALYQQSFVDRSSGVQDTIFSKEPLNKDTFVYKKQLIAPDTIGFPFLNRAWLILQLEFDDKGLYGIEFYSKYGSKKSIEQQYYSCLKSLEKYYKMERCVVGCAIKENQKIALYGYRFEDNGRIVQMHLNDENDSISSYVLSYIQKDE